MKYFMFLLLAISVTFANCKKEEQPKGDDPTEKEITVNLKATYDGMPLQKGVDYIYQGTQTVDFLTFTLFLSDVTLLNGNTETKLSEIEFFNFFSDPSTDFAATQSFKAKVLPGKFDGIKIGFGVKPDLNRKRPSDFPSGHPLTNEIEYWLGWKSYIFTKIEANADVDDVPGDEIFLNYHCGSSSDRDVYREGTKAISIDLGEGKNEMTITFDLKRLLEFNGKMLNLKIASNTVTGANPNDLDMAISLLENFIHATSVE